MLKEALFTLPPFYNDTSLLGVLLILIIIIIFVTNNLRNRNFTRIINSINGPPSIPFIGNGLSLLVPDYKVISVFRNWAKEYGTVFRIWLGNQAYIFVADPEVAERVLSSKVHLRKAHEYDLLHPFLGNGLSTLNGPDWSKRRRLISSIFFNFKGLEDFLSVFNEQSFMLIEKLRKLNPDKPFNIHPYITQCALNIICETAMGRTGSDVDDLEYMKTVHEMCEVLIQRIMMPWLRPNFLWKLSPQGRKEKKMKKILHKFINKVIHYRKKMHENEQNGDTRRQAFLDLLLDNNLSDDEIRDETQTFIFGGHDTTASSLSWTLFLIASNPKVQENIELELNEVFGDDMDRPVTLNDIAQLKYVECCIKEALRLYPSAPFYGRYMYEDLQLPDGRIFPATSTVFIAPIMLHKNPKFYPNPDAYDPSRFFPQNLEKRNSFTYIPFSAGPRNCIGQKFAMMEEKVVIANILRRFTFEPAQKVEDAKYILELTLKPKDGPLVKIKEKNKFNLNRSS